MAPLDQTKLRIVEAGERCSPALREVAPRLASPRGSVSVSSLRGWPPLGRQVATARRLRAGRYHFAQARPSATRTRVWQDDGNLFTMRNFTDQDRTAIAKAWLASGVAQGVFAERHGISPRTLRHWVGRHAPRTSPERVRGIVADAVLRLQVVLAELDADSGQHLEAGTGNDLVARQSATGRQACHPERVEHGRLPSAGPCRLACRSDQASPPTTGVPLCPATACQQAPDYKAGHADSNSVGRVEAPRPAITTATLTLAPEVPAVPASSPRRAGGFFANWDSTDEEACG